MADSPAPILYQIAPGIQYVIGDAPLAQAVDGIVGGPVIRVNWARRLPPIGRRLKAISITGMLQSFLADFLYHLLVDVFRLCKRQHGTRHGQHEGVAFDVSHIVQLKSF